MRQLLVSTVLVLCLSGFALASGTSVSAQVAVTSAMTRIQAMRLNDVARFKVMQPEDVAAAGLKDVKAGDEIEVDCLPGKVIRVKHLLTGQTGTMPQPAQ